MIMKSRYLEDINNEVIEELSNYVFTPSVDFKKWDTISVSEDGEYIELYRDDVTQTPVYDSKGELMYYNYDQKSYEKRYRRDKFSGECFQY